MDQLQRQYVATLLRGIELRSATLSLEARTAADWLSLLTSDSPDMEFDDIRTNAGRALTAALASQAAFDQLSAKLRDALSLPETD
jgi:hypothetical protein